MREGVEALLAAFEEVGLLRVEGDIVDVKLGKLDVTLGKPTDEGSPLGLEVVFVDPVEGMIEVAPEEPGGPDEVELGKLAEVDNDIPLEPEEVVLVTPVERGTLLGLKGQAELEDVVLGEPVDSGTPLETDEVKLELLVEIRTMLEPVPKEVVFVLGVGTGPLEVLRLLGDIDRVT